MIPTFSLVYSSVYDFFMFQTFIVSVSFVYYSLIGYVFLQHPVAGGRNV